MKNQKGITLVALIITIIVMLILAGVSISLVVGENGVLTQAENAGDATARAEAEQAVSLAFADLLMQYYGSTAEDKAADVYKADKVEAAIIANGAKEVDLGLDEDEVVTKDVTEITVNGIAIKVELTESTNASTEGLLKLTSAVADTTK